MRELEEKVPRHARFVFQEAHRDIRLVDGLKAVQGCTRVRELLIRHSDDPVPSAGAMGKRRKACSQI